MTSDDETQGKKNLNPLEGLELDDDLAQATDEDFEDIDDIEEIIEASPLGSELDSEDFSGDDDDFTAELSAISEGGLDTGDMPAYDTDDDEYVGKSGGMKKVLAPALVLVMTAGVAGYIMMNPAILTGVMGGGSTDNNSAVVANVAEQDIVVAVDDARLADESDASALAKAEAKKAKALAKSKAKRDAALVAVPPQPSVNMNSDEVVPEADTALKSEADVEQAISDVLDAQAELENVPEIGEVALLSDSAENVTAAPVKDVVATVEPPTFANDLPVEVSVDAPAMEKEMAVDDSVVELPRAPAESAPVDVQPEPEIVKEVVAEAPEMPKVTPVVAEKKVVETKPADPENDIFENDFKEASGATPAKKPAQGLSSDNDSFYDSEIRVPGSQIAGPRKLDPRIEPATKFVVATQDYKANDQEALVVAANRALKLRRYDAARDMFDSLYAKNKRDKRILMGLAVAQQNTGRIESAIKTYEELLDIDPDNADAMVNMLGLIREQYPSVALRRLMDLQSKYPSNAGIAAQIGVTQADLGQHNEAVRYLSRAASLDPQNAQHLFNLAIVTDRQGHGAEAISYYEQALEVDTVYGGGQTLPRETIYDRLAKLRRR